MPVEEWENVIKVNLTGAFFLAKACIPPMLEAGQGAMVLFSSRAAKTGFAALGSNGAKTKAHYCASKAGVISLVKSLAMELAPYGIRVNGVAPGPVQGTMIPKESWPVIAEKVPLNRLGTPEEMAEGAWFLCSPQAAFITGHILDINGGTLMDQPRAARKAHRPHSKTDSGPLPLPPNSRHSACTQKERSLRLSILGPLFPYADPYTPFFARKINRE